MLKTGPHLAATCLASEASTLADLFARRVTRSGDVAAYFVKEHGKWRPTSWRQFDDAASRIAHGLVERGINPGDRVAILGPTEASWVNQDIGAQMAGAISLGIYPKQSVEQVRYILEHGEARLIFVADETELGTVLEAARDCERLEHIVPWTQDVYEAHRERDPRIAAPGDFLRTPLTADTKAERRAARASEDTAIFVYTSGTTGPPKCAMISHANIMSVLRHQTSLGPLYEDDISLSFLPMAHVAERVLAFYGRISAGFATAYASSISAVLDELREVRPTVFGSVPRIFEKAYARIDSELARKPPIVRKLFAWAVKIGKRRLEYSLEGRSAPPLLELQFRLADRLVFRRIRDAFGGRVRQFITGAAPTPMGVLEFFWSAGLPIYEVYGMTEATVVTHGNAPGHTRLGTVGRALGSVEHRIADDGEILIRGPLVFEGYFKDPEATASTIVDGWLHTGDIGIIDDRGFVFIKDRIRDVIISGGFNVYPSDVEAVLGRHPEVKECVVFGVPDMKWGEAVTAAVELHHGATVTGAAIAAFVKQQMDSVKAPKTVHIVDELPRSPVGKVLRREAKARFIAQQGELSA